MWGEANSGILRCQPDSGYVFNMNITNSGGYKVVKRMRLMPKREVDFEPSIYDSQTGLAIAEYVSPGNIHERYEQNSSSFSYTIATGRYSCLFSRKQGQTGRCHFFVYFLL